MRTVSSRRRVSAASVVLHVILTLVSLFVLYPIVYVIAAAFSPGQSIGNLSVVPFGNGVTMEHFEFLLKETLYLTWFKNSFLISAGTAILTVVVCSLSAYLFSRVKFTGRKFLLTSFLVLQVFPSFVGMIALYVILWRMNGLDTLWGMVLIYTAANIPYNTWMIE